MLRDPQKKKLKKENVSAPVDTYLGVTCYKLVKANH